MKTISIFILLFLSACLMTHKDIKKSYDESEDDFYGESAPNKKEIPPSITEKLDQMNESLRELRGQVERIEQEQNNKIKSLEKNLLPLVQSLDLQMAALENKVEKQIKNTTTPTLNNKETKEDAFLKAENLFKEKKWKAAIINYEKYRGKNKKGSFYKQATFRIGQCFLNLNMRKEGSVFLREVISSYPKSKEAKSAKQLLQKKS